MENEVKDVVEEIDSEKDVDLKRKQREELLVSLREDIISHKRDIKEKEIEIKTLTKRQEELITEIKELKYSGRVKLDDELEHLHYLK
jgi:cell division protein FtsB